MTIARRFAPSLAIHCPHCHGHGQRLQPVDGRLLHVDCPDCAGTGMRNADDASSAQPHRFTTAD